ncbi:MAG: Holliday junction branch migration protein RuvA [Lachnospiraceae bacterium]|nr:Holliday junction branch migration protein RuvA [Lachnospiraceae bacterium]
MYAYIKGTLAGESASNIIIDNGGIGYLITVSARTVSSLPPKGSELTIYTEFIASENTGVVLYGFLSQEEKEMFILLQSVNGVGPKAAINILSVMTPEELTLAIAGEDEKAITRANGVGPKAAKRIILELKDKVDLSFGVSDNYPASDTNMESSSFEDVLLALTSMGYSSSEALGAIRKVENADDMNSSILLREALKKLAL